MDFRVIPIPGGGAAPYDDNNDDDEQEVEENGDYYASNHDDDMVGEEVPLTPRISDCSSTATASTSSSSLFQQLHSHHTKGQYLSFFRSPVPLTAVQNNNAMRFMHDSYSTDNRTRTPFYDTKAPATAPATTSHFRGSSSLHSSRASAERGGYDRPRKVERKEQQRELDGSSGAENGNSSNGKSYDENRHRRHTNQRSTLSTANPSERHRTDTVVSVVQGQQQQQRETDMELGLSDDDDSRWSSPGTYVPSQYGLNPPKTAPSSILSVASHRSAASSAAAFSPHHQDENLSVLSSSSHLFGESLTSPSSAHQFNQHNSMSSRRQSQATTNSRFSFNSYRDQRHNTPLHAVWHTVVDDARHLTNVARNTLLQWWRGGRHAEPPLSPRSRNLQDLAYLMQQHKSKVLQLSGGSCAQPQNDDDDLHYDFVLILQPQEVYAFWASLLDFRVELLGQEATDTMEANWATLYDTHNPETAETGAAALSITTSQGSTSSLHDSDEALDVLENMTSPATGLYQRGRRAVSNHAVTTTMTPLTVPTRTGGLYSGSRMSSPSVRGSVFDRAMGLYSSHQTNISSLYLSNKSDSPALVDTIPNRDRTSSSMTQTTVEPAVSCRRWGNHAVVASTPCAMSPPIRSLTRGSSTVRRPIVRLTAMSTTTDEVKENVSEDSNTTTTTTTTAALTKTTTKKNPNVLSIQDIPNQVIPRGIAARTNGMLAFLSALRRGFVVRRHRPGQEAVFSKIVSHDGGDTIQYLTVDYHEAMTAFKEQRVRYNRTSNNNHNSSNNPHDESSLAPDDYNAQPWSYEQMHANVQGSISRTTNNGQIDIDPSNNHFTVPDYVAAKQYREKMSREHSLGVRSVNVLTHRVLRTANFKAADIVAVHPARNRDPRESLAGDFGTATLRRSKSDHFTQLSFSVVLRNGQRLTSIDELEDRWHKGQGSDGQFKYLDFEAATEGEYWLIFRGLLLLHRDAAVGRFAEQRAAGIGNRTLELDEREQVDLTTHNMLHRDEFHEPVTVGCLERLIVKWRDLDTTYMEGFTLPGAVPPPSDYFLGFKSPGTAIWGRLRLAGLETQRVYSLDPKRVMIKVRCPSDRLMNVAEVLRLKLKTRDGSFAPFREDMVDIYQDLSDPLEISPYNSRYGFQFCSSFRQTIIDFIIGSRIRDSGAELGQTTDLGKLIQARVPLHMHDKLEAIYRSWFFFWREENWNGRDGLSTTHPKQHPTTAAAATANTSDDEDTLESTDDSDSSFSKSHASNVEIPGLCKRFLVGCFYQPMDSIEQYFGEKVAYYFAWLQHTATHLVILSAAGLIVFFCQLSSGNWDHPLRPFYSVFVMMWTIVVLINWRKRANFLAYHWGTMDYKEQETTRPQFHGDYARDEITNEWVVKYPNWKRWLKYSISFPLTLLFTGGTLIVILWVHANRDIQLANYMSGSDEFEFDFSLQAIGQKSKVVEVEMTREHFRDPTFWFIVVGMPSMLGLFLPLLNFILMKLSILLNDFENYRTESEYRSSLIIKVFSFRFVCYFATLYYYAFVSVGTKQAIENGILRVGTGVLVYTTVAQWWQNFLHVCFPIMIRMIRMRYREKRLTEELREIEVEEEEIGRQSIRDNSEDLKIRQIQLINKRLLLEQAQDDTWLELMDPQHDSFPEYIQAVVQFTFVSCFSVVLPITPLICLINYLMSMRLDAYKLCKGRRRPLAEKTGGIGVWEHLLHIVAVISILTNCWFMGFTSSQFAWIREKVGDVGLFTIVVAWEHVMLLIKYIMQASISPLPKSVQDAMKREQHELNQQRNSTMMARRLQHQREEDLREGRHSA